MNEAGNDAGTIAGSELRAEFSGQKNLQTQYPSQGWKQIRTARKEMLDKYDAAREKARMDKVETFHGRAAEAAFREWLEEFLPKRYAVTSGYIVSTGMKANDKLLHYDVIIYDALESPVLWINDTADMSPRGRFRAIPVEYVRGVLEVKSDFSSRTVNEAIDHLSDLRPLMDGVDAAGERYKIHLPPSFFCAMVAFELREENAHSEAALRAMLGGITLRGFHGGTILRGHGHSLELTGDACFGAGKESMASIIGKDADTLLNSGAFCASIQGPDGLHYIAMIMWSESGFARFAFDLVALLHGTFEQGRVSSWYGMGTEAAERRQESAQAGDI